MRNHRAALTIAGLAGLALTAVACLMIVRGVAGVPSPRPADLLPLLVAAAGLCVVGLTQARAPSVAWLATILVFTIATVSIAAWGRSSRVALGPDGWQWLAVIVCVGTVFATASAALYAVERPRRLGTWVEALAIVAIGLVVSICVWVWATLRPLDPLAPTSLGDLVLVTRALLAVVLVFTTLGIIGDLRPAGRRTSVRLADGRSGPGGFRGGIHRATEAVRIFIDELAPGRERARRAAGDERSRIALELHAHVIPVVRRALREAERGGSPERLAVVLRDVLAEIDGLASDRHSVVLEAFGLLPAIEWLAERTEERSDVRVRIDVGERVSGAVDPSHGLSGRPPRTVEAAAYRVAQLALENVVRHAPTASACIELTAEPRSVRLVIRDDGPGLAADAGAVAVASGRRGFADMRAAAAGCGGSLLTGLAPGGEGTVVRFAWPPD